MAFPMKIHFTASSHKMAQEALADLTAHYPNTDLKDADTIVALGGDGHLLHTIYSSLAHKCPIFAMRRTESVGFLCNDYHLGNLIERLQRAETVNLHPLRIEAELQNGKHQAALAINEVSIIRETTQSAKLRVTVDGVERIECYSGDGLLIATPAGSTAYNHSCGGPIMPMDANTLVMTAICGFRPRRWSHAVLPQTSVVDIDVLDINKRPVRIESGETAIRGASKLRVWMDKNYSIPLLFDPEEHLGERIIREQFKV